MFPTDSPQPGNLAEAQMMAQAQHAAANPIHPVVTAPAATATRAAPPTDVGPAQVIPPGQLPPPPNTPAAAPLELGGVTLTPEQFDTLVKGNMRQSKFTQARQDESSAHRARMEALDRREQAIAQREAAPVPNGNGPPHAPGPIFSDEALSRVNEEMPGMGELMGVLGNELRGVQTRQTEMESALTQRTARDLATDRMAEEDRQFAAALGAYEGLPFANTGEMAVFMRDNGLGVDPAMYEAHCQVAYDALYRQPIGMAAGAREAAAVAQAQPLLGSQPTTIATQTISPVAAAARPENVAQLPWGKVTEAAMIAQGYQPESV